jgi:hypothetical protein
MDLSANFRKQFEFERKRIQDHFEYMDCDLDDVRDEPGKGMKIVKLEVHRQAVQEFELIISDEVAEKLIAKERLTEDDMDELIDAAGDLNHWFSDDEEVSVEGGWVEDCGYDDCY